MPKNRVPKRQRPISGQARRIQLDTNDEQLFRGLLLERRGEDGLLRKGLRPRVSSRIVIFFDLLNGDQV